jgi:multidrug efflux pump subunit AcrB
MEAKRSLAELRHGVSGWCIEHPIATTLLTAASVLLGAFAFPFLPIAPLPQAEFPTISISAQLPGASPETMASAVATPLEVRLSAVPGITEMTSTSSLGTTNITLQFELKKDIDTAAQEVQAAINSAAGRLPADMPNLPTWRKQNPGDSAILILRLQSALMPMTELSDLAETLLARQISQIDGVSEVMVSGQQRPALRVQAAPEKLAAYGLTLQDIRTAVQKSTVNQAKGALFGERTSTLATNDQLFTAPEYARLIIAYRDGAPVRLGDVAKVSNGSENAYVQAWQNGRPGLNLMVRRQPDANIVETVDRIIAELPSLREGLPASVELEVTNDRTRTIRASLHEVEITLLVTVVLVVIVMGLFLRQVSATLIVTAVLVVALVATFAAMYALGFSLNNLTLVALIIAVGFVVDDAIVVVENIHRHLEAGLDQREAALRGSAEISFTVVSISVSLVAAFIPLLFMGGVVGRLFREFALTVTAAIAMSVAASLTLAPMLASRFMKRPAKAHTPPEYSRSAPVSGAPPSLPAAPAGPEKARRRGLPERLLGGYDVTLRWALRHERFTLASFVITVALAVAGYVYIPKGFFPLQDTGFIVGTTQAALDISYADMIEKHKQIEAIVAKEPAIDAFLHSVGATGGSQTLSSGRFWLILKDRGDRDASISEVIDRLRPQLAQVPGIVLFMRAAQDINLGARAARTQFQYALRSSDSSLLSTWADKLTEQLQKMPQLADVSNDQELGAAVTRLTIDRAAAARFGLRAEDIDQVLYDAFGQRQIAEYQTEVNQYRVVLEIDEKLRGKAESLAYFHLRSPESGQLVPLSAVARLEPPDTGPLSISHNGMFPAVNIAFNLAPGVALGDAVKLVDQARADINMPANVTGGFQGNAQAFESSLASQPILILAALLAVYIILGVLYESFVHPFTILSTLPSAGIGALLLLWLWDLDFSIMALIGIVLLIGIVKKNGILMVDFALELQRNEGMVAKDAVYRACLTRFRPILMTTIAAMLGAIPLMIGLGTGSELRQPLGIAVVGGLALSQILTLYTTPVVYLALDRWFGESRKAARRARRASAAPQGSGA